MIREFFLNIHLNVLGFVCYQDDDSVIWKNETARHKGTNVSRSFLSPSRVFLKNRRMLSLIIKLPPLAFFSLCFWIIRFQCLKHDAKCHFLHIQSEFVSRRNHQEACKTVGRIILKGFIFRAMHHRLLNTYGHNTKSKEWFNTLARNWISR